MGQESTQPPSRMPKTDAEWTIRALNIHGLFFERWCQDVVRRTGRWQVKSTNYPVEFPPAKAQPRSRESSAVDIWAELPVGSDQKLTLLIECKKHNPEFVNWIFFPNSASPDSTGSISQIDNTEIATSSSRWLPHIRLGHTELLFITTNEFRETRQDYSSMKNRRDKTRTANATVSEAAYQIALARQAIVMEEVGFSEALGVRRDLVRAMPWGRQTVIPMIVTSARLWLCHFDPRDVSASTGEIPLSKATLAPCTSLMYEYPVPQHLQLQPADLASAVESGLHELFVRMHILIVQSDKLEEVLLEIEASADKYLKSLEFAELATYTSAGGGLRA